MLILNSVYGQLFISPVCLHYSMTKTTINRTRLEASNYILLFYDRCAALYHMHSTIGYVAKLYAFHVRLISDIMVMLALYPTVSY